MTNYLQKADHKVKHQFCDLQILFLQNAGMERYQRLKLARERHFRTAKEAAMSLGVPYGTYSGHESGVRGIKDDELILYARRLKAPLEWLAYGIGQIDDESLTYLQLVGRIGAGAQIDVDVEQTTEGGETIETTIPLPAGAIGFEVTGDSMWPRYDPGDIVVCFQDGTPLEDIPDGEEAAVRTIDGLRYLKRVVRTERAGIFNLESHNAPSIRGVSIDWASDVVAVIRKTKWRGITAEEQRRLVRRTMAKKGRT